MSCITTFTGKRFDPVSPDDSLIDITDIAHALSLLCRGNGHVKHFFSVAQHCINCRSEAAARNYSDYVVLACLLHDASEAYMADVPRPVKQTLYGYSETENRLLDMIYTKYLGRIPDKKERILIKQIDDDNLYFDLKYLLGMDMESDSPVMKSEISQEFEPFENVEKEYMEMFIKYYNKLKGGI